jgi:cellulose synthase/poly-beta-1,6-N-acetylglucosamine synthase-like glycosyltransferase/exo-beta-1,3-glucanase (GH17 family)
MRSVAAVVVFAACLHAAVWAYFQPRNEAPNIQQPLASVSYAPFEGVTSADDIAPRPTAAQIHKDLAAIAPYTNSIRTYSSTGGLELVPQIAAEFGLRVTLGIWLDPDVARNEREIRSAIEIARRHSNVKAIVVGNETTLRASLVREKTSLPAELANDKVALRDERKADEEAIAKEADQAHRPVADLRLERNVDVLLKIISRVKRQVSVPVTTGETWDIWLGSDTRLESQYQGEALKAAQARRIDIAYRLAASVDFIAAHILPYWDRASAPEAVEHTIEIYNKLRKMHEGKRVVIAEFGWPSGGYNRGDSEPGRIQQATIVRNFVSRADALGIDYNVIEAFDQPWKSFEGSVGSYWGLFDASRTAKFAWTGSITNPNYGKLAAIAVATGLLVSLPILAIAGATLGQIVLLAFASHIVGAWAATVFDFWNGHYFVWGAAFAFFMGLALLVPLILIALSRVQEIACILFGRQQRRLLTQSIPAPEGFAPKVSIHIPAHMEAPDMLLATLDSVSRLTYSNLECIVVINNTPDPNYWRPIEDRCRELGERFKFLNVNDLQGFKAGALRLAFAHTAPDAEIIGVLDADYVVHQNWLTDLVPAFADAKVGLIQAPQDHRDSRRSPLHHAMNGEYAGFFDIGMVERNETNAIIVHGTMCLVRRAALEQSGGWSSDTICEDTDLGLSILENGWLAHYTNRRYGHGLLPDTFEAYKKQRHRWAYGGVQIARKHWRRMLPGATRLTRDQRREFSTGWLNWLGAESIGVVVAIFNLIWVPIVAFVGIAIPDKILTLPILAAFVVSLLHFAALYRARVAIPASQAAAAMIAAMAMQWTVARAVGFGLIKDHLPFVRTAKGGVARKAQAFPAFNEALLGGLLVLGAIVVFATNYERVREINLFACVLLVQSVPFLAAAALAAFEDTRFNSFAYWYGLEARLAAPLQSSEPTRLRSPAMADMALAEIAVSDTAHSIAERGEAAQQMAAQ